MTGIALAFLAWALSRQPSPPPPAPLDGVGTSLLEMDSVDSSYMRREGAAVKHHGRARSANN